MDTGPNGSTLAKHHYVTREEVDRLNRQHLDALNATIIKQANAIGQLLAAAQTALDYLKANPPKVDIKTSGGFSALNHHANAICGPLHKAIANATP